jgi:hypothetical protein
MSEQRRQQLTQEIEAAFALAVYPGDDHLVDLYHSGSFCEECAAVAQLFRGQDWHGLTKDTLVQNRDSLLLFRPAAYRFYLPAYLTAALQHWNDFDTFNNSIVASLTPPNPQDGLDEFFGNRVTEFTPEQKAAICEFLKLYTGTRPTTLGYDKSAWKALRFWERYK